MSIESLHASEEFAVVAARDQNLGVRADSGLEDGEWAGSKFVLFELSNLVLSELIAWLGQQFLYLCVRHRVVVGKLLERNAEADYGYNAATNTYQDLVKAGIIDPLKVVRTALSDAASVSSLLTTSEAIVVEAPKKDTPAPAGGMGGGMGGMGGMGDMY